MTSRPDFKEKFVNSQRRYEKEKARTGFHAGPLPSEFENGA